MLSGACFSLPSASAVLTFHRMLLVALFRSFRWLAGSMRVEEGGGKNKNQISSAKNYGWPGIGGRTGISARGGKLGDGLDAWPAG